MGRSKQKEAISGTFVLSLELHGYMLILLIIVNVTYPNIFTWFMSLLKPAQLLLFFFFPCSSLNIFMFSVA